MTSVCCFHYILVLSLPFQACSLHFESSTLLTSLQKHISTLGLRSDGNTTRLVWEPYSKQRSITRTVFTVISMMCFKCTHVTSSLGCEWKIHWDMILSILCKHVIIKFVHLYCRTNNELLNCHQGEIIQKHGEYWKRFVSVTFITIIYTRTHE